MNTSSPRRNDHVVLRLTLALLLLLALTCQAQGSTSSSSSSSSSSSIWRLWRRRSLLSEVPAEADDSPSITVVRLVAEEVPPPIANGSTIDTAVGSNLHASDQCGGAGGLCNQTTIGIPCGDHMWQSVNCPQNFSCTRRNASYWQCTLLSGMTAPKGSHFNSSKRYAPEAQRLPQIIPQMGGQPGDAAAGSNSSSSSSSKEGNSDEPIVPVCGPDTLKGPNRMCNRTSHFVLPLDQINPAAAAGAAAASAAGGGRDDSLRGTAALLLRLAAALLAVAAGAAALGI
uniref:CBM1 domain-containing protein n=1 Tax=Tetradesmus obliquus TaxID=3088 RepID=A0A383WM98_TETOB|eukprot:jgi/Sobl393_1/11743/SZX77856.1